MTRIVRCGLIQATNPLAEGTVEEIKQGMIKKHLPMVEDAARKGVQILCLQEIFHGPYFCCEQDIKWYGTAETVPGPVTELFSGLAKKHRMVIVLPIYEKAIEGVYYNTAVVIDADGTVLGKMRKVHIPHTWPGFWEKFYFKPGNLGFPVFQTAYAKIGVFICYDRHFPECARILALRGAEILFNPSATTEGKSKYLWSWSSLPKPWPTASSSGPTTASGWKALGIWEILRLQLFCRSPRKDPRQGIGRQRRTGRGGSEP
jgi:N-carbamoylputrescine amidase